MSKSIIQKKRILTKAGGGSSISVPVSVANGGTGITSYTIGDIIYASGATTLSKLADVATGNALISGGVGVAPSWGKIGLTTHVSGTLPIANGGTNASTASIASFNNITGYSAAGATGTTSTNLVFSTSPTLVTPVLGAATGTSLAVTGALTTGVASSAAGTVVLQNATNAFTQTIRGTNPVASIIYDLPTTAPTAGQVLSSTAPAAGVSTLSWATAGGGLTVGTTTITSGTSLRIPYNLAGVYQEQANFTIGSVATGYLDVPSGYAAQGVPILYTSTGASGYRSTHVGYRSGDTSPSGDSRTALGFGTNRSGTGTDVISLGAAANYNGQNYNYSLFIGSSGSSSTGMQNTAANQAVIGMPLGNGYTQFYFGQGVSTVTGTPSGVTFNATPGTTAGGAFTIKGGLGSGSNVSGGILTLAAGVSTGNATPPSIIFQTGTTLGSGSTLQTLAERFRVSETSVKISTGFIKPYVEKTALYTLTPSDYLVNCTSGTFTLTLPTAVGFTGQEYVIKNIGTGVITIATTGGQTIDGVATATANQWDAYVFTSDGANWIITGGF